MRRETRTSKTHVPQRILLILFLTTGSPQYARMQATEVSRVETGYVTSNDGVRLYYAKVGNGSTTVILPGRLFLFSEFRRLAKGRTFIFFDMRDRGRSDAVSDPSKISLQHDTDDLEAVRAHFGIEETGPDWLLLPGENRRAVCHTASRSRESHCPARSSSAKPRH